MRSRRMPPIVPFFCKGRKDEKHQKGTSELSHWQHCCFFPSAMYCPPFSLKQKARRERWKKNWIKIISWHRHRQSCFPFFFLTCVSLPSFSPPSRSALPWHQNKNPLHGFLPESRSIPAMCTPDIVKTSFVRVQNISLTCLLPKSGTFGLEGVAEDRQGGGQRVALGVMATSRWRNAQHPEVESSGG